MDVKRRYGRCLLAGLGAALFSIVISSTAVADPAKTSVILGTATKGGGFQLYGAALAAAIEEADQTLSIDERPTKGSKENLPLLEAGKLDIGLVEGNAARDAFDGIGRPKTHLKIITAMYPNPGMFVVLADSPYRTIEDLKGKRIAWGTKASGLTQLGRTMMDGLGLDIDKDFQPVYLEKAGDGPKLLMDGKVAAFWGGGIGWPGFKKVAAGPKGARFIGPTADEIKRIQSKHDYLKPMAVPAKTYKGQTEAVASLGQWAFVFSRETLPDDTAYRLARAVHKAEPDLAKRLPQGAYTTSANTAAQAPNPELIHPGVARFLREQHLLK